MAIIRNTFQRDLVLNTVNSLKNHTTADEVYDEIAKTYKTVSRTTVYRNLNQLADNGLIKKVIVPNGAVRFDHNTSHHYHAQCNNCGKVIDITVKHLQNIEDSVENTNGFKITSHDIIFFGLCKECQNILANNTDENSNKKGDLL